MLCSKLAIRLKIGYTLSVGNHYKDSLFRSLFSDKKALLELYNSIKGTHYDEQTELVINTLTETMFASAE